MHGCGRQNETMRCGRRLLFDRFLLQEFTASKALNITTALRLLFE